MRIVSNWSCISAIVVEVVQDCAKYYFISFVSRRVAVMHPNQEDQVITDSTSLSAVRADKTNGYPNPMVEAVLRLRSHPILGIRL